MGELSTKDIEELKNTFPELVLHLKEKRRKTKEKLTPTEEALINNLAIEGYSSWWEFWQVRIGEMTFPCEGKKLSFGQVENKVSSRDLKVRKRGLETNQSSGTDAERGFAQVRKDLGGFRQEIYRKRKCNLLKEALDENRMSAETLDAMWDAI